MVPNVNWNLPLMSKFPVGQLPSLFSILKSRQIAKSESENDRVNAALSWSQLSHIIWSDGHLAKKNFRRCCIPRRGRYTALRANHSLDSNKENGESLSDIVPQNFRKMMKFFFKQRRIKQFLKITKYKSNFWNIVAKFNKINSEKHSVSFISLAPLVN